VGDGVPRDDIGKYTSSGLNSKSVQANVNEDDLLCALLAGEDTALDSSTVCHSFIRADALGGFFATKEL
jgi:hypothetical protein